MGRQYHCCASCVHYRTKKERDQRRMYCERLGYETKPHYQFNCWHPKPEVRKLMQKEDS